MEASRDSQSATQTRGPKKRTGTSKYDFFKVKVWLGENMDHYYILSRFLICRMLTVTKIPYIKAVKVALETKKYLVDNNLTDIKQAQLEDVLFSIIRSKGFDEQYIDCYRMVTQFYQSRQPLCIIICGTAWTGKSTIAQQLASRINIPNVMQTDIIYELLRAGPDSPLAPQPLWCAPGLVDTGLVSNFRREAQVVRKGMDGDLIKTLSDGKPIIIEGMHLDPGLYIRDFGQHGIIMLPARPTTALQLATLPVSHTGGQQYKRSFTSQHPLRDSDGAAAATAADGPQGKADAAAAGGSSTPLSRCISVDAELPVVAGHFLDLTITSAVRLRPCSAGHNMRTQATAATAHDAEISTGSATDRAVGQLLSNDHQWQVVQQQHVSGEDQQQQADRQRHSVHHSKGLDQLGACTPLPHEHSTVSSHQHVRTAARDSDVAFLSTRCKTSTCTASAGVQMHEHEEFSGNTSAKCGENSRAYPHTSATHNGLPPPDAAAAALAGSPAHCSGLRHYAAADPPVIMLDQLQVCAATAEAVALQQASQEQQGQQWRYRCRHGAQLWEQPQGSTNSPPVISEGSAASGMDTGNEQHTLGNDTVSNSAAETVLLQQQQQQAPGDEVAPAQQQQLQEADSDLVIQQLSSDHSHPVGDQQAAVLVDNSNGYAGSTNSASQLQQGGQERVQKPLFVPILVYMDETDHTLMQEEALSHVDMYATQLLAVDTAGSAGGSKNSSVSSIALSNDMDTPAGIQAQQSSSKPAETSSTHNPSVSASASGAVQVGAPEALRRMRLLQEYLCAYEAQGLPVVKVSYGNFGEALDKLHEYILQCIKLAMQL